MRIVDVNEFYAERGGGVKTYVNGKLQAAARLGHELLVVAPGPRTLVEERPGGRVQWIEGPPLPIDPRYYLLWNEAAVHAAIDAFRPDLIEGSSPWTAGWFAGRYPGPAPKVWFFHQDPVAVYPHTFLDRLAPRALIDRAAGPIWAYLRRVADLFDATVVGGRWLADRLRSLRVKHPVPVPLGIDKELFAARRRDPDRRARWLHELGLAADATLLVGVSRHHPEKRIGTLLDAVRRVNRRRPVGLLLFGDGPLRRWVERRAAKVPHVRVAGFVADREAVADAVANADGFLHGSAAETFGLVVAEAICAGTPIVIPSAGGALDLAAPGHAELYTPGDAVDCAEAIERLASSDLAARRRAATTYAATEVRTMSEHFDHLFELYESLTKEQRS